jgi:hypothetical protein
VLVSFGVPKGNRRSYMVWVEGKAPDVVFEFASERSWRADLRWKRGLYMGLGVREYFLFDPTGEYFQPPLQGYRLQDENYESIEELADKRGMRGVYSAVLGLELWMKENGGKGMPYVLRLYDPATVTWLETPTEEATARRAAEARAAKESAARRAAEAQIIELQAEVERLRGELAARGKSPTGGE